MLVLIFRLEWFLPQNIYAISVTFSVFQLLTSNVSNIGVIEFESKYNKYIDNVLMLVMPNKLQKIKCSICSYEDNLNITINSNINDLRFEKIFYELL